MKVAGAGMTRVSMGDVWDDTRAFVAREAALLFPLGFATVGLAALLYGLAVPTPDARGEVTGGAWMLVLAPVFLLTVLGALSISALVLRPGGSVSEALRDGARRLGPTLLATVLVGIGMTAVMLAAMLVAALVAVLSGGGATQAASISVALFAVPLLWLAIRLAVLVPLIVAEPPSAKVVPKLRRASAMTRGHAGRIAWVALIYAIAGGLTTKALQYGIGTILLLAGRALGMPGIALTLTEVVLALAVAVLQCVSLVFQAMLFRRLVG